MKNTWIFNFYRDQFGKEKGFIVKSQIGNGYSAYQTIQGKRPIYLGLFSNRKQAQEVVEKVNKNG